MNGQKPIADPEKREENSVRKMFARIAPFYDVINRAMTFGLDVVWRKRLVRKLGLPCGKTRVADLACGSGDVAVEILRRHPNAEVVCADFCPPMLDAAKAKLESGELHVFDTATFTVDGKALESYMADVDTDADYEGDHEAVSDGYFHESAEGFRSAPYFDVKIDGIDLLDTAF